MNVPRVSIDIASTSTASKNSEDLKNKVKYLKTVRTYEDKNEVDPPKVQQPPQVITIQESDEASFTSPVEFKRQINRKTNDREAYPVKFNFEVVSTNFNGNGKLRIKA